MHVHICACTVRTSVLRLHIRYEHTHWSHVHTGYTHTLGPNTRTREAYTHRRYPYTPCIRAECCVRTVRTYTVNPHITCVNTITGTHAGAHARTLLPLLLSGTDATAPPPELQPHPDSTGQSPANGGQKPPGPHWRLSSCLPRYPQIPRPRSPCPRAVGELETPPAHQQGPRWFHAAMAERRGEARTARGAWARAVQGQFVCRRLAAITSHRPTGQRRHSDRVLLVHYVRDQM